MSSVYLFNFNIVFNLFNFNNVYLFNHSRALRTHLLYYHPCSTQSNKTTYSLHNSELQYWRTSQDKLNSENPSKVRGCTSAIF